jgi:hypothetical protein
MRKNSGVNSCTVNPGNAARADSDEQMLPLSAAVAVLMRGMFGGLPQAKPVHKIKRDYQKASVVFGPWKESAQQRVRMAAVRGELPVYVKSCSDPTPLLVPPDVIARLMVVRGGLPDHPIRPTLKIVGGNERLLRVLQTGTLLVREKEFASWYNAERRRSRWPSQQSSKKSRSAGRPTKMTAALQRAVADALRGHLDVSVAQLRRMLLASGRSDVPSVDTLERLLGQLYRETGDPRFFRAKRRRRKRD